MPETNADDRRDVCAALLTMASISSSYKVESTNDIIGLWKDIKTDLPIADDLDYISTILSLGRIVDLQADQINIEEISKIVSSFRSRVEELSDTQGSTNNIGTAFLTMSCVSHSDEVESTSSIVSFWDNLRSRIKLHDHLDLAAAILATGRIMDLRIDVKSPEQLREIVQSIRAEMEVQKLDQVDFKELAILLLASAIVELSPKVEKYRDIIQSWVDLRNMAPVSDIKDVIAVILFAGKIRDMDISMFIYPSSIAEQIQFIRSTMDHVQ